MAPEPCTTLKNQGYHFAHTDGHGEQNRSVVFATLRRLAVLVDQTQPLCCALFQAVWAKLGSPRLLWERLRALFYDDRLASLRAVVAARVYGFETAPPVWRVETSCSLSVFSRGVGRRHWALGTRQGVGLSAWRTTRLLKAT